MAGLTTQQNLETLSAISAQLTHDFKEGFTSVLNRFRQVANGGRL